MVFRLLSMLASLATGALLPELSPWAWLIRWILFLMLFTAFLELEPQDARPVRGHARLLLAWPLLAAGGWLMLRPFGEQAALAGFLVGATPTATAAPVITGLLGGNAGFVTVSVIGTNIAAAFLLPILLHALPGTGDAGAGGGPMLGTIGLVLVPLGLALSIRRFAPGFRERLRVLRRLSFPLWIVALALAAARTSRFLLDHPEIPRSLLGVIFAGSGLMCAANFALGRYVGRPGMELEAGQSLGQKNTMLTLWLGLVAAGPVAALGPASYVLWHNVWNGIQLSRRRS